MTQARYVKVLLSIIAVSLVVYLGSTPAHAKGSYLGTWQGIYPGSVADDNVINGTGKSCQLCHAFSNGGDGYDGYGWRIRLGLEGGLTLTDAILSAEPFNSDNDPTGAINLEEINANTQPGWTPGPNNTIFFKDQSTIPGQPPPAGILGGLDPSPAPDIDVSLLSLDFGVVTVGATQTRTTTITNLGAADLTVIGFTVTGSADFALNAAAPATPFTVAPGATVDVAVDYMASDEGSDAGALDIESDDPDEPVVSVSLAGTGVAPAVGCDIGVSITPLDFGTVVEGTTRTLSKTIGNNGDQDCIVNGLTITGSADFALNPAAPATPFALVPTTTVDVPVDYTPSSTGDDAGTLDISSDDPDQALISVPLAGTGIIVAPDIDVTPVALNYGVVTVGTTQTRTVTIRNLGNADLRVTGFTLTGSPTFMLGPGAPATPFTLAPGAATDLPVIYAPTVEGPDSGTLEIASDDPNEAIVPVPLNATGGVLDADIDVTPSAINFGTVTTATRTIRFVTIANVGAAELTVTGLSMTGSTDFQLISDFEPPFTIRVGQNRVVEVHYVPSDVGPDPGTLEIASDDPDENSVSVALSGTAEAGVPDVDVTPLVLDFGTVPVATRNILFVTIGNLGNADLTVTGLTLTGSTDFELGPNETTPFVVRVSRQQTVEVHYVPLDVGPDPGTLEIASDDPDENPVSVALSGTSTGGPQDIDVAPLALDFGAVTVSVTQTLTATLTNLGGTDLTVSGLAMTGSLDFALNPAAPATPFIVAAGASRDLPVDYTPLEEGTDSGTLDIASDDPDEPLVSVSLAGTGLLPAGPCDIDVNPLSLDFGSVDQGASATVETTVGNSGSSDCAVVLFLSGSTDFALNPATPTTFTVVPGGSQAVLMDYAPSDTGDDSGALTLASNDPDEDPVTVSLTGSSPAAGVLDFEIANFRTTKNAFLRRGMSVEITLVVKNVGTLTTGAPATVVGMQNGIEIYSESLLVQSALGGAKTTFTFPSFLPTFAGTISWQATIADDNPDTAFAETKVKN